MPFEIYFHGLWDHVALDAFAVDAAQYGLFVVFIALGGAWLRRRPPGLVLPALAAGLCALAADLVAGLAYHEPRPFLTLSATPLLAHSADNAFPSDHSVAAAYAATLAVCIDPALGVVAWIVTVILGVARMYCLLHTPLDVGAGFLLGAVPALIAGLWCRGRSLRKRRI